VALWAFGFVRASVRARTGGCGSGSSLSWVKEVQPCITNPRDLTDAIERSELIAISDGPFKDNLGTTAWRIVDINMENQPWTVKLLVPGQLSDMSAFRSELSSHNILVSSYHDVQSGTI
jgi:hypothetical protein